MAEKKRGPGRPPGSKNKKTASKQDSKAREKAKEIQAKRKADRRVMDEIWSVSYTHLRAHETGRNLVCRLLLEKKKKKKRDKHTNRKTEDTRTKKRLEKC